MRESMELAAVSGVRTLGQATPLNRASRTTRLGSRYEEVRETHSRRRGARYAALVGSVRSDRKEQPLADEVSVRVGALVVPVPMGFHRRVIQGHEDLLGILVTDYRVAPGSPTLSAGVFPASGVALSIARGDELLGAPPPLRLPLSVSKLRQQVHADGTEWNGVSSFRGRLYAISIWIGNSSPRQDRAAIRQDLSSTRVSR